MAMNLCQLCEEEKRQYHPTIFRIDGMILCDKHAEEYIHSEVHPSTSVHRKKFNKLLNRMEFHQ